MPISIPVDETICSQTPIELEDRSGDTTWYLDSDAAPDPPVCTGQFIVPLLCIQTGGHCA